jgi:hypothetical protein
MVTERITEAVVFGYTFQPLDDEMNEPKTFLDESFIDRKIHYDVHENGLIYRPNSDEEIRFSWTDIQYIDDLSGDRVEIFLNEQKQVPIRYATNEFPLLLKTICLKLSEIHNENVSFQEFSLTLKYYLHLTFVVVALVLSLIGSFFVSNVLFFILLALSIPVGIFVHRHPISLTLDQHALTVRNLYLKRDVDYSEIKTMDFEVKRNDYESTLCIILNLKNRKIMTIKKIEKIILFFILLQIKLNENIEDTNSRAGLGRT